MFEVTCLDSYGNPVTYLTQWDKGQSLIIENTGLLEAPFFHFCNKKSTEALVVPSSISTDGTITVNIPNCLLKEPYSIIAYIYVYENDQSAKTLFTIQLPLRKRAKPSDYTYIENIEKVTLDGVNDEIKALQEKLDTKQDCFVQIVDLSGSQYSQSTYYPVTGTPIPKGGLHKIHVYTTFDMDAHPTWATNAAGYTCNMEVYDKAQSWGQTNGATISTDYSWKHSSQRPCGYVQMTHSSTPAAILRGGGIYCIETDYTAEWTVRTEAYTVSGDTVRPGNASKFDFDRATVFANINGNLTGNVTGNATSADKWKTGRYIDGSLIDGAANRHHFGVCSTAGATAAKTCTIPGLAAADGARATVQFTNANTAANPTLNINGVGAFPIYWRGEALPGEYIYAGAILELQYITSNGAGRWCVVGDPTQVQVDNLRADVDGIEIGGRNLLRDSKRNISSAAYKLADFRLTEDLTEGETVTMSLKGAIGIDRSYLAMYNSGGNTLLGALTKDDLGNDGVYRKTFSWKSNSLNQFISIYNMPSTATSASEIEWIKLERGNKATDWTPAPEDKTDVGHTHDDRYYTEAEIDTKLAEKKGYYSQVVDLSAVEYDQDTWYPVIGTTLTQNGMSYIKVSAAFNAGIPSVPWSTHADGRFYVNMEIYDTGSAWGATTRNGYCVDYSCRYTVDNVNPCGYSQMTNSSTPVIWLRGRGKYYVFTDFHSTWTINTETYTVKDQSVAPVTACPGISLNKTTIYADLKGNALSADKMNNKRKINGVNFDGTADVTFFGVDGQPEGVENKAVKIPNFTLADGVKVTVCFAFGCLVDNPTLNVSGTGDYPIMLNTITPLPNNLIDYNDIAELVYYQDKWYLTGCSAWSKVSYNKLGGGVKMLWSGVHTGTYFSSDAVTTEFIIPKECFFNNEHELILMVNGFCPNDGEATYDLCMLGMCFGYYDYLGNEIYPYLYGNSDRHIYKWESSCAVSPHNVDVYFTVHKVADSRYAICEVKNCSYDFCLTSISAVIPQ